MNFLTYYYTGKVTEIRQALSRLQEDDDGRIALNCSPEALGLLDPAKSKVLCNREAYLDARHTLSIVLECIKRRKYEAEKAVQESYERKFTSLFEHYHAHRLGFNLEFRSHTYRKLAEGQVTEEVATFFRPGDGMQLIFPETDEGIIECNFFFKNLLEREQYIEKTAESMVATKEHPNLRAAYKAIRQEQLDGIITELHLLD